MIAELKYLAKIGSGQIDPSNPKYNSVRREINVVPEEIIGEYANRRNTP